MNDFNMEGGLAIPFDKNLNGHYPTSTESSAIASSRLRPSRSSPPVQLESETAAICPVEAISEGTPFVIDPEKCTDCGACASVCPSEAISQA